jgi:hypothetical protein
MTIAPLPRSLDPLPAESLPGYVLRLAHRLEQAPARIADLTGLMPASRQGRLIPLRCLLRLEPLTMKNFTAATRLSEQEARALCLSSLGHRYPPLDLAGNRAQLNSGGIIGRGSWVFTRSTRYCPACLAGNGAAIQQLHGGAWQKLWHLPVVFACTTHRRLLTVRCPQCQGLVHAGAGIIDRPAELLHPAQCRNTTTAGEAGPHPAACGARLDAAEPDPGSPGTPDLRPLLALQEHLLDLLQPGGPPATTSIGQEITVSRYFTDLRLVAALIRGTWPQGRHWAGCPAAADALGRHVTRQREHADRGRREGLRRVHDQSIHGTPAAGLPGLRGPAHRRQRHPRSR